MHALPLRQLLLLPLGACKEEARSSKSTLFKAVLFKEDEAVPPVRTWRHGRGHLLLVDECAERQGRERALPLRRRRPSRRPPPLRRARDAQRRLLGGNKAAVPSGVGSTVDGYE